MTQVPTEVTMTSPVPSPAKEMPSDWGPWNVAEMVFGPVTTSGGKQPAPLGSNGSATQPTIEFRTDSAPGMPEKEIASPTRTGIVQVEVVPATPGHERVMPRPFDAKASPRPFSKLTASIVSVCGPRNVAEMVFGPVITSGGKQPAPLGSNGSATQPTIELRTDSAPGMPEKEIASPTRTGIVQVEVVPATPGHERVMPRPFDAKASPRPFSKLTASMVRVCGPRNVVRIVCGTSIVIGAHPAPFGSIGSATQPSIELRMERPWGVAPTRTRSPGRTRIVQVVVTPVTASHCAVTPLPVET